MVTLKGIFKGETSKKIAYDTNGGRTRLGNMNNGIVWKVDGNYGGGLWENRRLGIPAHRGGADDNM